MVVCRKLNVKAKVEVKVKVEVEEKKKIYWSFQLYVACHYIYQVLVIEAL